MMFSLVIVYLCIIKIFQGSRNDLQSCSAANCIANTICAKSGHIWDDDSIPLDQRNKIGRAIYQTPKKIKEAKELINYGKIYRLGFDYADYQPQFLNRTFVRQLHHHRHFDLKNNDLGVNEQAIYASALGNTGTQFDGLAHVFQIDPFKTGILI